jgi:hypothetical protein
MSDERPSAPVESQHEHRRVGMCRRCQAPIYWVALPDGTILAVDRGREMRVAYDRELKEWRTFGTFRIHSLKCAPPPQTKKRTGAKAQRKGE